MTKIIYTQDMGISKFELYISSKIPYNPRRPTDLSPVVHHEAVKLSDLSLRSWQPSAFGRRVIQKDIYLLKLLIFISYVCLEYSELPVFVKWQCDVQSRYNDPSAQFNCNIFCVSIATLPPVQIYKHAILLIINTYHKPTRKCRSSSKHVISDVRTSLSCY